MILYFRQLTAQIQTKRKVSKLSSLNVAFSPLPGRSAREVREEVCIQCMRCCNTKENLPEALQFAALDSVPIQTTGRENRLLFWVEAYQAGLGSLETQFQVKKFSLKQYESHRRIPENMLR